MHLWPSMRLRDSFSSAYLKKLEWNLHRMNTGKQRQQNHSETSGDCGNLLNDENYPELNSKSGGFVLLCREILMILSCCCCCFCCGACVEEESS